MKARETMLKYLKEYRFYIILFAFILVPVIAIDTTTRSPREYRFYDRVVLSITSPIESLISSTLDFFVSTFQDYIYLLNVRKDNLTLLDENKKLLTTIVQLKEADSENKRLRKLLNFQETFQLKTVLARVIAKDVSTEFRAIRINRGEDSGIKKDMAVLTSEGIVGRVIRTTSDTSDVMTILDLLSGVDTIVERTRIRGIVEGLTDEICRLKFTYRTDDVQPSDILISSGLGGIFPKGVPIGSVIEVDKKSYGITQNIKVAPSVDFSKLEEVIVVTALTSSPIHVLQSKLGASP